MYLLYILHVFTAYTTHIYNIYYAYRHSGEAKMSFIRYISHEIRTPLNTVSLGMFGYIN